MDSTMRVVPKTLLEGLEGRLLLASDVTAPTVPPVDAATARAESAAPLSPAPLRVATRPVPKARPVPVRGAPPAPIPVQRVVIKSANANSRAHAITVTWAPLAGATGYRVERSPDNQAWSNVAALAGATTGFTDVGLAEGTTYWYRVRADTSGVLS